MRSGGRRSVGLGDRLSTAFGAEAVAASRNKRLGYLAAVGAAALAGLIPVFGKQYLSDLDPLLTAGFANLLAGLVILPLAPKPTFKGADRSRLVAIALIGAAAAPILYWQGLPTTSSSEAALLVNVETVFTMTLAVAILREKAGPVEVACVLAIVVGAIILTTSLRTALEPAHLAGNLLIVAGTALWAFDNNLSTGLSRRYSPQAVAAWKNVIGASLVVAFAALIGADLTRVPSHLPGLMLAGGLGTGVSLTLFYIALRHIGAYRTSAVFGIGGIFGAAAAFAVLGERLSAVQVAGAGIMVAAALALALTHREPTVEAASAPSR